MKSELFREEQALKFYRKLVSESLKEAVLSGRAVVERSSVFSSIVTVWLMIMQRINPDHSLEAALEHVQRSRIEELLEDGVLRARSRRLSKSTGGYSRARSRLSLEVVEQSSDAINEALCQTHKKQNWNGKRVFAVDGTTLRLTHTKENCASYPQYTNQHGKAHFPLLYLEVATDVVTGVALRPAYGAYSREERTNELEMFEELLQRIPQDSVVIGDRFYGCARFSATAHARGLQVLCRVKESDAERYIGKPKKSFRRDHYQLAFHSLTNRQYVFDLRTLSLADYSNQRFSSSALRLFYNLRC